MSAPTQMPTRADLRAKVAEMLRGYQDNPVWQPYLDNRADLLIDTVMNHVDSLRGEALSRWQRSDWRGV